MFIFFASSCNKNWSCTCQFPDGSISSQGTIESSDQDAATEYCNNFEMEAANIGADCTLSEN